jgi:glycosyltransferase involved in cell wall biosynthesis
MTRKVVLLGPYPPPYGGVSIYIQRLFHFIKQSGVELWTYGDEEINAPNVFFMKDKRWDITSLLIKRGSDARVVDCTHFLIEHPSFLVPVWVILKKLLRFEWLKIVHDGSLPTRSRDFGPVQRLLFSLAIRSADQFIVVSEELKHWLRDEIRVKQEITVIAPLLPIPPEALDAVLPSELETALLTYLRSEKRVCSVGVFIPTYGFAHVAEAVEQVRGETGEDIGLVLFDGKFARDEDYRSSVLDGRDWITVLENVPNSSLYRILSQSHALVRAFGQESYGISRVEALLCGLTVVATRVGETRGMLIYDFGDVDGLKEQLKRALFDPLMRVEAVWAEKFRGEADDNLRRLRRALGLSP